jgi:hypothetical protein
MQLTGCLLAAYLYYLVDDIVKRGCPKAKGQTPQPQYTVHIQELIPIYTVWSVRSDPYGTASFYLDY